MTNRSKFAEAMRQVVHNQTGTWERMRARSKSGDFLMEENVIESEARLVVYRDILSIALDEDSSEEGSLSRLCRYLALIVEPYRFVLTGGSVSEVALHKIREAAKRRAAANVLEFILPIWFGFGTLDPHTKDKAGEPTEAEDTEFAETPY